MNPFKMSLLPPLDINTDTASPHLVLDAMKANMCGFLIKEISTIKTAGRCEVYQANRLVLKTETLYIRDPSPNNHAQAGYPSLFLYLSSKKGT